MSMTFKVGDMTVHRIIEMECGFTPALEFLPNLTPEVLAENRSWLAPAGLDAHDNLVLCFQSYVVQTGKHNILVDSCVGNDKDRPARALWHQKKDDAFMRGLKAIGLTVNDIHFVLCTHLHVDHVGWNTRLENGRWVPTFPKARYLFGRRDYAYFQANPEGEALHHEAFLDSIVPVMEAGQGELVDEDHAAHGAIGEGVWLEPAFGHSPGCCMVGAQAVPVQRQRLVGAILQIELHSLALLQLEHGAGSGAIEGPDLGLRRRRRAQADFRGRGGEVLCAACRQRRRRGL